MCIVAYTLSHPKYSFALAANRDEYLDRPTEPAHWHHDNTVLSGVDVTGGGTWLGLSKTGRIGLLTNFTEPPSLSSPLPSRGCLAMDWLINEDRSSLSSYAERIEKHKLQYAGFNLLVAQFDPNNNEANNVYIISNRSSPPVSPDNRSGVICNGRFDDENSWPKVGQLKQTCPILNVSVDLCSHDDSFDEIWSSLSTQRQPSDISELRKTIMVPPVKTSNGYYGTRVQTIVLIERGTDQVTFLERTAYKNSPDGDAPVWDGLIKTFNFNLHE